MKRSRQFILGTYYHATRPLRTLRNAALARQGRAPIMAITYHRVADDQANAWTTATDHFVQQIDWLQRHFDLVSIEEAQRRIRADENHRAAVTITFDDGYAENCQVALPLLIQRGIPFTYFVTSDCALQGRPFQHDIKMGNHFEPNSLDQLKALAASGVEIGSHTRTHTDLGQVTDPETLYEEVIGSRIALTEAVGVPVRYFAFPFGQHEHLNRAAFRLAREQGFEAIVGAYGGYNFCGDDPFHLQRMCVDGPTIRLKNWTTLDPYKQLKISRYDYTLAAADVALSAAAPEPRKAALAG